LIDFLDTFFRALLIFIVVLFLIGLVVPMDKTVKANFFDGQVAAERARHNLSHSDTVTFIFTQPGTYSISFFPKEEGDSAVPSGFTITVTADDVPMVKVVKKFSIHDLSVMIIKDGHIEQQDLFFPEE